MLGLLPSQGYQLRVAAYNACGETSGPVTSFTTSALPQDLPAYVAGGPDPSPGFVVFAAGQYDARGIVARAPFTDPLASSELGSILRTFTIR